MALSFEWDRTHGVRQVVDSEAGKVYAHNQRGYWLVRGIDGSRFSGDQAAGMADRDLPRTAWRWLMWLTHETGE